MNAESDNNEKDLPLVQKDEEEDSPEENTEVFQNDNFTNKKRPCLNNEENVSKKLRTLEAEDASPEQKEDEVDSGMSLVNLSDDQKLSQHSCKNSDIETSENINQKKDKKHISSQYNLRNKKEDANSNSPLKTYDTLPSDIDESFENEIDEILEEKAWKNNLSAINVKNILRHVITNKHVLAMVRNTMREDGESESMEEILFEPKLTRSKTKELFEKQVNIPWPISPIKKQSTVSTSCKLMETEFSEEENSSDEEYTPGIEISDEDENQSLNQSTELNLPASPSKEPDEIKIVPEIVTIEAESTENDTIAYRTRSKLPLVDTPLETIEATLTAPDITTDMYDSECDDEEWKNFLKEFVLPQDKNTTVDGNDDENEDPEYNFLEEEEEVDREDMRDDRAVKIPKKEVGELMAELFEAGYLELNEVDEEETKQNQSNISDEDKNGDFAVDTANRVLDQIATESENSSAYTVTSEERQQLEEQMRKHVQLLTQGYILCSSVPEMKNVAEIYKTLLIELQTFAIKNTVSSGKISAFNAFNLTDAVSLISLYKEDICLSPKKLDSNFRKGLKDKLMNGYGLTSKAMKTISEEKIFIYSELLPVCGFISSGHTKTVFTEAENMLIILGIDQFCNLKEHSLTKLIHLNMLPVKTEHQIRLHIKNLKSAKAPDNPIKRFLQHKILPETQRRIFPFKPSEVKAPCNQPIDILPQWLQKQIKIHLPKTFSNIRPSPIKAEVSIAITIDSSIQNSPVYVQTLIPESHFVKKINTDDKSEQNTEFSTSSGVNILKEQSSQVTDASQIRTTSDKMIYVPSTICNDVSTVSVLKLHPTATTASVGQKNVSLLKTAENALKESIPGKPIHLIIPSPNTKKVSPLKHVSPILKKYSPKKMRKTGGNLKRTLPILPKSLPPTIFITQPRRNKNKPQPLAPKIQECIKQKEINLGKNSEVKTIAACSLKEEKHIQPKESFAAQKTETGETEQTSQHTEENILSPIEIDSQSDNELFEDEELLDNAEDLAALMAASSTIKSTPRGRQQSVNRKISRQQRDLEAMMEMLAPDLIESDPLREEKETAIAQAYLFKVKEATKDNEEIFIDFLKLLHDFGQTEKSVIQLHKNICKLLKPYPEVCDEFAMFLLPEQAMECGKLMQYHQFMDIRLFLRKIEVHFRKHPQHIQKIIKTLAQCQREVHLGMDHIKSLMQPLFRNQSHLMEEFLHLFPDEHPPESLMTDFEEVTLPDSDAELDDDGFEIVTLPDEEDEYGGKNCRCHCHVNTHDPKMQNRVRHCFHCGIKFIDGRIYIQSGKTLKPVHIEYINPEDKQYVLSKQSEQSSNKTTSNVLSPVNNNETSEVDVSGVNPPSPCFESSSVSSLSPVGGKDSDEEKDTVNDTEKVTKSSANSALLEALEYIEQNTTTNLPLPSDAVTEDAILTPDSSKHNPDIPQDFSVLHVVLNSNNSQEPEKNNIEGICSPIKTNLHSSSPKQINETHGNHTMNVAAQNTLNTNAFLNTSQYAIINTNLCKQSTDFSVTDTQNWQESVTQKKINEVNCWTISSTNTSSMIYNPTLDTSSGGNIHTRSKDISIISENNYLSVAEDQCGISAKNHSVDEKGEVVVLWTRDADRLILSTCQQMGPTDAAFYKISTELKNKSVFQVRQRFTELITLFSQQQKQVNDIVE